MPSKGILMNGQFGAADTSRYEDEYNTINKKPAFKQLGPRPTSGLRRNNPHPTSDFLLPKNLMKMDDEQKFQSHIQSSVRDHLMKLYQTGNVSNTHLAEIIRKTLGQRTPSPPSEQPRLSPSMFMRESEMMENYVNPTEDALERIIEEDRRLLKREQGNSYKKAGHIQRNIADEKEQLDITSTLPLYQKIDRKPTLGSEHQQAHSVAQSLHWPKAHPPTPGGKRGLNDNLVTTYHAKYSSADAQEESKYAPVEPVKRLHTPPTPPEHSSRRVKSASYEAQAKTMRAKSQAGSHPIRSKSVSPLLEKRPKTAGPQLAKSMITHPRMKSWIDSATDYEKQVAYSLIRTISGRKTTDGEFNKLDAKLNCTPAKPIYHHPSRKMWAKPAGKIVIPPATNTFDAYIPPSPAPVTPVPDRNGRKDNVTSKQWMDCVDQAIHDRMTPQEMDPRTTIQMFPRGSQQRPHARHQPRAKLPKDYRHDNSFFNFTKRPPVMQFTISPDWVSENMKPRRKPKMPLGTQLRYGSMV